MTTTPCGSDATTTTRTASPPAPQTPSPLVAFSGRIAVLEGLVQYEPQQTRVVETALWQEEAATLLQQWYRQFLEQRRSDATTTTNNDNNNDNKDGVLNSRPRKRSVSRWHRTNLVVGHNSESAPTATNATTCPPRKTRKTTTQQQLPATEPNRYCRSWLWQSLCSYSTAERRLAWQLLVSYCRAINTTGADGGATSNSPGTSASPGTSGNGADRDGSSLMGSCTFPAGDSEYRTYRCVQMVTRIIRDYVVYPTRFPPLAAAKNYQVTTKTTTGTTTTGSPTSGPPSSLPPYMPLTADRGQLALELVSFLETIPHPLVLWQYWPSMCMALWILATEPTLSSPPPAPASPSSSYSSSSRSDDERMIHDSTSHYSIIQPARNHTAMAALAQLCYTLALQHENETSLLAYNRLALWRTTAPTEPVPAPRTGSLLAGGGGGGGGGGSSGGGTTGRWNGRPTNTGLSAPQTPTTVAPVVHTLDDQGSGSIASNLATHSTEISAATNTTTTTTTTTTTLSPLACLIGAYFALQEFPLTYDQAALRLASQRLQQLIDPTTGPQVIPKIQQSIPKTTTSRSDVTDPTTKTSSLPSTYPQQDSTTDNASSKKKPQSLIASGTSTLLNNNNNNNSDQQQQQQRQRMDIETEMIDSTIPIPGSSGTLSGDNNNRRKRARTWSLVEGYDSDYNDEDDALLLLVEQQQQQQQADDPPTRSIMDYTVTAADSDDDDDDDDDDDELQQPPKRDEAIAADDDEEEENDDYHDNDDADDDDDDDEEEEDDDDDDDNEDEPNVAEIALEPIPNEGNNGSSGMEAIGADDSHTTTHTNNTSSVRVHESSNNGSGTRQNDSQDRNDNHSSIFARLIGKASNDTEREYQGEEDIESIEEEDDDDDEDEDHVVGGEEDDEGFPGDLERSIRLDETVDMDLDDLVRTESSFLPPPAAAKEVCSLVPTREERQRLYVQASMQVLAQHYPHHHNCGVNRKHCLSSMAESALLKSVNKIVKPPRKPLNTKVVMRRAPTQEEFFRGSLSQNPIPISVLKPSSGAAFQTESYDPTVADLRMHIANDLQMAESAELIEILVAGKILDIRLKLRVVHQVLWRRHLIENPTSGLASYLSSGGILSRASGGLSIFFATNDRGGSRRPAVDEDTPAAMLPAMIATYRLAGVDGEATEDTVNVDDLIDPEAPGDSLTSEELEKQLEKEYGITALMTEGRGVFVLLRSVQNAITETVRRVRRDDVACLGSNPSRTKFKQSPPCQALTLLRHCSKLPSNRKKLLQARAPTILLTLLLEVLKALEISNTESTKESSGSNPTADVLQELIESLTSDISINPSQEGDSDGYESDMAQDAASMPLLLQSIETISLSPPLRSVIAKLLPFLTYGQADLSKELAQHFDRHIVFECLAENSSNLDLTASKSSILMQTFLDAAISLPANEICNTLRLELINCGFVNRLAAFLIRDIPRKPPSWAPALWLEADMSSTPQNQEAAAKLLECWRLYFRREGLSTGFRILIGLLRKHTSTQDRVAEIPDFIKFCHWLESTSDNLNEGISTCGVALLAETLLDESCENQKIEKMVHDFRSTTKLRKKQIALQKRNQALLKMGAPSGLLSEANSRPKSSGRNTAASAASFFAPVLGFFGASNTAQSQPEGNSSEKNKAGKKKDSTVSAWLEEAEMMLDETGLKCAVCQEGQTLQPKELLGLYAYVRKIQLPANRTITRQGIDGTDLLKALPPSIPATLVGDPNMEEWYVQGLEARSTVLETSETSTQASSRKSLTFTTTVSAGNAIHFSCHRRARQADRTRRQAKSEWEGAALRNSRVNCNVIIPLVSSHSSTVPLIHVNSGLSDYQTAVSNVLGLSPTCMLWPLLHDLRFLILRMAYGESLSVDCGGGSLASNCLLLFYQMRMADMFDKDAQIDHRSQSLHARNLSSGCLVACSLLFTMESKFESVELAKGVADATPMACLCSVLFHNSHPCGGGKTTSSESDCPHPKREWLVGRELFLRGLILCGGRRHVLSQKDSGCQSQRSGSFRKRASSFTDWDTVSNHDADGNNNIDDVVAVVVDPDKGAGKTRLRRGKGRSSSPTVEDFQNAFRPMLAMFAIFDQISTEFRVTMDDRQIEESAQRLAQVIENCQRSRSIYELIQKAKVPLDQSQMMDLLQRGILLA